MQRSLRVHFSSATGSWRTAQAFYDDLDREFHFDFDPCPAKWREGQPDGLFVPWTGRRVFCNPPYGPGLHRWLQRAGEADLAVFLLPARTDTRWFHEIVLPKAKEIRFVKGRLVFGDAKFTAPFPSVIVVFEGDRDRSIELKG